MKTIQIGNRVQRNGVRVGTAHDYTNGRQGEVMEIEGARIRVRWTHEMVCGKNEHKPLNERDVKRTWVKITDVFRLSEPSPASAASSVAVPRKVYLERKGDTVFVMFEDRAKGQRRAAAQFYKDEKGAVAWVKSNPSMKLVESPHRQVKCVSGFYPTSDIACDFKLPHGGFCVEVTTTNNDKMETLTVAAFATKKEAMEYADGLSIPWASWMRFDAPADSDTGAPSEPVIVSLGAIFGESPGSVDVGLEDGQTVRVALEWEHLDIDHNALTDAGHQHVAAEVRRKTGHSPASPSWLPAPAGVTGQSLALSPTEPVKMLGGEAKERHTSFPWKVEAPYTGVDDRINIAAHPVLNDNMVVAQCFGPDKEANAEFIARACASHAAHLAKIQALTEALNLLYDETAQYAPMATCDAARSALAFPSA